MTFTEVVKSRKRDNRYIAGLTRAGKRIYGARRKVGTAGAAVLAVMVGYHIVFGQNGVLAYQAKRHDAVDLKMQVERMQHENEQLRGHVDRLSSDPNAIEHEAREDLHYTRPGEVIFTLPSDPKAAHR